MSIRDKVTAAGPSFLEFAADQEPWCQWTLENGTVIRARLMLVKVIDEGTIANDGAPRYQCQFQQVMDTTWPDHIKREIEARRERS